MDFIAHLQAAANGNTRRVGGYVEIQFKIIFLGILFIISGCASVQSYSKPGVDFSKYKKIAIVKFYNPADPAVGQEVADILAMEFMRQGYTVVERSQLAAVIDEDKLLKSGLTSESKNSFQTMGVDSIFQGSVSRYGCQSSFVYLYGSPIPTNVCHASFSMKMLDIQTGEVLWATNAAHSINDINATAHKVLLRIINKLDLPINTANNAQDILSK